VDYTDFILNHRGVVSLIDVTYTNNFNNAAIHANTQGFTANKAEELKLKEITQIFNFPPDAAIGFGIELHGTLGNNARKLLSEIHLWTKSNDPFNFQPKGLSYAYRSLSLEICRTNSTIADCCRYYPRRNNPRPGAPTPTSSQVATTTTTTNTTTSASPTTAPTPAPTTT
jgi:hypothetical protein